MRRNTRGERPATETTPSKRANGTNNEGKGGDDEDLEDKAAAETVLLLLRDVEA